MSDEQPTRKPTRPTDWRSPADYLRQAHAEFSSAVEAAGFELSEVTLFFYEDEEDEVRVRAELRITAELLDLSAAADGAIGAPRPQSSRVLPEGEN
jgi:hypothetical protein